LNIPSVSPFIAEDNNRTQLRVADQEVSSNSSNYQKIIQGTNIRLDNVSVNINYAKGGFQISEISFSSKKVTVDVGEKEK